VKDLLLLRLLMITYLPPLINDVIVQVTSYFGSVLRMRCSMERFLSLCFCVCHFAIGPRQLVCIQYSDLQ
jgi:hypothetical protein